jgi:hypothetical protein
MRIGVMTPTYNRPDFARFLVLQMQNQQLKPDVLCIHQNGTPESYEWSVLDIQRSFDLKWIHTPENIKQDDWYIRPLEYLISENCTHFFWCDHDDLYSRNHIANSVNLMGGVGGSEYDFVVNSHASILALKQRYEYLRNVLFNAHAPGGMSSSMCFNRSFALELLADLRKNIETAEYGYSDQVVERVTKKKFRCLINQDTNATTTYVAHSDTVSSYHWLVEKDYLYDPLTKAFDASCTSGLSLLAHLGRVGDSRSKDSISLRGGKNPMGSIEGFSINDDEGKLAGALEYCARWKTGEWSDWADFGTFVGTRGLGRALSGYSVRLKRGASCPYEISLAGLFASDEVVREVALGEACVGPSVNSDLIGIQIVIRGRLT